MNGVGLLSFIKPSYNHNIKTNDEKFKNGFDDMHCKCIILDNMNKVFKGVYVFKY